MEALALRRSSGDDPRQVGDLMRRIARSAMWRADFPRAMALAREAVTKLEPLGESHELAMAYAGLSSQLFLEAHSEESISWGGRALAMAERLDDDEARVHAFNNIGCAELQLGRESGFANLQRSLALGRATGNWFAVYRALFNLAASAAAFQQLHRAEAAFDELARFSASNEVLSCNIDSNRAEILLGLGRLDEAEAAARNALNIVDGSLDPLDASVANAVLGRLMARRGDPGATAFAQRAIELVSQTRDLYRTWLALVPSLEIAWLDDDLGRLLPQMQSLLDAASEHGDPWVTAEIALWVRRSGGILPDLRNLAGPHRLALAGDWRAAAADWRERGNMYESALALLDGDDPAAVREAHDILARLGAVAVLPKVAQRLRKLGAPVPRGPRQSTAANAAGLTEREAEIAELVAAGLSNHEIAERLVLSDKTVGHHVSAILGKLGVRRRAEVAARLGAEGAAPR
jgi:ATP/maltotriose-dependent transcriptional regulator MalT